MVGVPGDEQIRTDETHPINRMFADVPQDEPEVARRAGLRGRGRRVQPVRLPQPQRRHVEPVSVVSVCKASLYCPTTEEYILPVIHGNDRVEWFVQLSDEILWDVEDRDTGAPRAQGHDEGRRRRGDARRHPPPGLQPEALDAAGVGERLARAARADPHRQGAACTRSSSERGLIGWPASASLREAVAELVHDGDTVALEGFTHLIPHAAGHEIIRQGRRDLHLVRMTPDMVYDQLIGAGCATQADRSRGAATRASGRCTGSATPSRTVAAAARDRGAQPRRHGDALRRPARRACRSACCAATSAPTCPTHTDTIAHDRRARSPARS